MKAFNARFTMAVICAGSFVDIETRTQTDRSLLNGMLPLEAGALMETRTDPMEGMGTRWETGEEPRSQP